MDFTLKQLRYVEAAGRLGSIANAADDLDISQSSITAAIDIVEKNLGFDLFIRMPAKGIQTTQAGVRALEHIRELLDEVQALEGDLKSIGGGPAGILRIGCITQQVSAVLPPLLTGFAEKNPDARIEVLEGDWDQLLSFLKRGLVDVVLSFLRPEIPGVTYDELAGFKACAILPSKHRLARKKAVSFNDLAPLPMICLDMQYLEALYSGLFRKHGLELKISHLTPSLEVVRAMVASGLGFSMFYFPIVGANDPQSGYCVRPIVENLKPQAFGIAVAENVSLPDIAAAFVNHCKEESARGALKHLVLEPPDA